MCSKVSREYPPPCSTGASNSLNCGSVPLGTLSSTNIGIAVCFSLWILAPSFAPAKRGSIRGGLRLPNTLRISATDSCRTCRDRTPFNQSIHVADRRHAHLAPCAIQRPMWPPMVNQDRSKAHEIPATSINNITTVAPREPKLPLNQSAP